MTSLLGNKWGNLRIHFLTKAVFLDAQSKDLNYPSPTPRFWERDWEWAFVAPLAYHVDCDFEVPSHNLLNIWARHGLIKLAMLITNIDNKEIWKLNPFKRDKWSLVSNCFK